MDSHELYHWTAARIDAECRSRWGTYDREKTAWYREYFRDDPHRHPKQAWSAKSIACALPPRWEELAALLPSTHTFHLSGKSSKVLALGLLGASSLAPSHDWLRDALNLPRKPKRTPAVPSAVSSLSWAPTS